MAKRRKGLGKHQRMRHWTSPNKAVIQEYASHVRSLSSGEPVPVIHGTHVQGLVERFKDVKPAMVMPERGHQIPEERDPAPPFIRVILKLWSTDRHQGIMQYHYKQKYPHPKYGELILFFSGNNYCWGYLGADAKGPYLRLSQEYVGRQAAWRIYEYDRFELGKGEWRYRHYITADGSPPPT